MCEEHKVHYRTITEKSTSSVLRKMRCEQYIYPIKIKTLEDSPQTSLKGENMKKTFKKMWKSIYVKEVSLR